MSDIRNDFDDDEEEFKNDDYLLMKVNNDMDNQHSNFNMMSDNGGDDVDNEIDKSQMFNQVMVLNKDLLRSIENEQDNSIDISRINGKKGDVDDSRISQN